MLLSVSALLLLIGVPVDCLFLFLFFSLRCSDIAAGEQIFLSYINEEQSKTERRADLRDYGFVCQCARCQTEESDQEDEEGGEDDNDVGGEGEDED